MVTIVLLAAKAVLLATKTVFRPTQLKSIILIKWFHLRFESFLRFSEFIMAIIMSWYFVCWRSVKQRKALMILSSFELSLLRLFSLSLVFGEVFLLLGPAINFGQSFKSGFGDRIGKRGPFCDLCDFFERFCFVMLKGKSHHFFNKVIEFIFNFNIYLI